MWIIMENQRGTKNYGSQHKKYCLQKTKRFGGIGGGVEQVEKVGRGFSEKLEE